MRCYYEVLNVSKDASDDDLKKAYRKLALRWHPDKNPDNIEEAKREFILIQQAYEVLCDPQERAFYDRHKDSILKGHGSDYQDESLDIFPYFSTSCYKGYDDSDKGFYTIYAEVFNKLAAEESEYLSESDELPPEFGKSDCAYEEVKSFYGCWSSFCTKKSYTWLNTYNISEAENRRILRLMEQENKKVRERAKKERNEEIRALVAFVRKRDPRVKAYAEYLKQKTEENSKKAEENRRKMIEQHRKNIESYRECEWAKFSNLEKELEEIETNLASEFNDRSDDSEEDDSLFCVACNKYFRTEKAFANHEKSKKHKENAEILKSSMVEEEELFNDASESEEVEDGVSPASELSVSEEEYPVEEVKKASKSKKKNKKATRIVVEDNEDVDLSNIGCSKKQRKKLERERILLEKLSKDSQVDSDPADSESEECPPLKEFKSKRNKKKLSHIVVEDDDEPDLSTLASSKKQRKKAEREKLQLKPSSSQNNQTEISENSSKSNKKKDKKNKRNYVNSVSDTIALVKSTHTKSVPQKASDKPVNVSELDLNHECASCKEIFDSKNKLFQHLKTSGHQILLPKEKSSSSRKKR